MTEETMTTTRFTQLPMEWVTGVTRERIMYEICWYMWKLTPAISTSGQIWRQARHVPGQRNEKKHAGAKRAWLKLAPEAATAAGVKRTPSNASARGAVRKKETMVMREKRLMLSMEPLGGREGCERSAQEMGCAHGLRTFSRPLAPASSFLESTLRDWMGGKKVSRASGQRA